MSGCFPERESTEGKVKAELDLSNYTTKADLKNAIGVDSSKYLQIFEDKILCY